LSDTNLAQRGLFKDLPEQVVTALSAAAESRSIRGGETLVTQGEKAIALYYVQSGRFNVVVNQSQVVASVGAGEVIGELAFFAGGRRTANVVATRDSVVLRISREDYEVVSNSYPQLNETLLQLISSRLIISTARTASMEEQPAKVIAVMAAGSGVIPEYFLSRLAASMKLVLPPSVPVQTTNSAKSTAHDFDEYQRWLSEQEARGGYILIDASGDTRWSERVCRNADALIMVGDLHAALPAVSAAERSVMSWIEPQQRSLVLFRQESSTDISGSRAWIEPREPRIHHHVALDSDKDFAKLARFLTGRAIGIVLAGGGALGCAHLGVIQALQDADIPLDFIGGASAGAAMGCSIANGNSVAETIDQMEEMFVKEKAMRRLTLPVHSLLDPTVFDQQLKLRYTALDIADQPINFFATSTNLSTNKLHIHRSGPRWQAVRASGSLPTVLPPFIDEYDNILVDGGVLDNSPVAVMHDIKAGPNIVVALADHSEDWRLGVNYSQIRGRWALLRDIALRRKRKNEFPSIVEVMSRSMVISSRIASRDVLGDQDLIITPPIISGMQLFDWQMGRELAASAHSYTQSQIDTIKSVVLNPGE